MKKRKILTTLLTVSMLAGCANTAETATTTETEAVVETTTITEDSVETTTTTAATTTTTTSATSTTASVETVTETSETENAPEYTFIPDFTEQDIARNTYVEKELEFDEDDFTYSCGDLDCEEIDCQNPDHLVAAPIAVPVILTNGTDEYYYIDEQQSTVILQYFDLFTDSLKLDCGTWQLKKGYTVTEDGTIITKFNDGVPTNWKESLPDVAYKGVLENAFDKYYDIALGELRADFAMYATVNKTVFANNEEAVENLFMLDDLADNIALSEKGYSHKLDVNYLTAYKMFDLKSLGSPGEDVVVSVYTKTETVFNNKSGLTEFTNTNGDLDIAYRLSFVPKGSNALYTIMVETENVEKYIGTRPFDVLTDKISCMIIDGFAIEGRTALENWVTPVQ